MKSILASTLTLVSAAAAQQVLYGQCGGKGWTGQTTCASGLTCQVQNEWYSQCLPGTAAPTTSQAAPTTIITSTKTASSSPPTSTNVGGTFASVSGTRFTIDGVTKYYAGTNCYWCSVNGLSNADVDLALDHIASSGLKILRVWGFNDVNSIPSNGVWFQYLSSSGSTINTGANGLQRLDYVVQGAEKRGIKLIIPFVNNWGDYGGYQAYVNAFGGSTTSWYTNSAAQTQYKKYIQAVVSRYTTSTAILAWELANEPRCPGCNTDVIYNWAKSTSAYIKSLDRNHLVTLGDEGFGLAGDSSYPYGYSEGLDFAKNLRIPDLDFGTLHMYPGHWSVSNDWGNKWINDHAAACRNAGKPCFLEEYGANGDHCSIQSPWQKTSAAASGMAGDAFWQHGDKLSIGNSHDDGYTIYYNTPDWTCLVTNHVKAIG